MNEFNSSNPYQPPAADLDDGRSEYVGFWARVFAAIIDSILTSLVMLPPMYMLFGASIFGTDPTHQPNTLYTVLSILIPAIIVFVFWIKKAATPGKMLIKSIIVDAMSGAKPTPAQWTIRYIGYFISIIPFGLGLMWVGWDSRKQGWHDKMAKTLVVKKKPRGY